MNGKFTGLWLRPGTAELLQHVTFFTIRGDTVEWQATVTGDEVSREISGNLPLEGTSSSLGDVQQLVERAIHGRANGDAGAT